VASTQINGHSMAIMRIAIADGLYVAGRYYELPVFHLPGVSHITQF
jgi:hypothetical protein